MVGNNGDSNSKYTVGVRNLFPQFYCSIADLRSKWSMRKFYSVTSGAEAEIGSGAREYDVIYFALCFY